MDSTVPTTFYGLHLRCKLPQCTVHGLCLQAHGESIAQDSAQAVSFNCHLDKCLTVRQDKTAALSGAVFTYT